MRDNRDELNTDDHLLIAVARQMRQPLLQISRQAELGRLFADSDPRQALDNILVSSDNALRLIDNYVLSLQAAVRGEAIEYEPVSVMAVLHEAAHKLEPTAKQYGVRLEIDSSPRLGLVQTNSRNLEAAFVSLGYSLIEALASSNETPDKPIDLSLAAHRCRYGVVAGMYCNKDEISVGVLRRGRELQAKAQQPHFSLSSAAGAGVFVADSLLKTVSSKLTVSRYHNQYGLAAILPPVNQLQLV